MATHKKRITKQKTPTTLQRTIIHLAGTAGYILWLFGTLIPLTSVLIVLLANTSDVALAPPENASFEFNIQPSNIGQSLLLVIVSVVFWYAVAAFMRSIVETISNRSENPVRTWWLINIGGLMLGWLLVGIFLKAFNVGNELIIGVLTLVLSMGIVSFGLEYFLGSKWHLIG